MVFSFSVAMDQEPESSKTPPSYQNLKSPTPSIPPSPSILLQLSDCCEKEEKKETAEVIIEETQAQKVPGRSLRKSATPESPLPAKLTRIVGVDELIQYLFPSNSLNPKSPFDPIILTGILKKMPIAFYNNQVLSGISLDDLNKRKRPKLDERYHLCRVIIQFLSVKMGNLSRAEKTIEQKDADILKLQEEVGDLQKYIEQQTKQDQDTHKGEDEDEDEEKHASFRDYDTVTEKNQQIKELQNEINKLDRELESLKQTKESLSIYEHVLNEKDKDNKDLAAAVNILKRDLDQQKQNGEGQQLLLDQHESIKKRYRIIGAFVGSGCLLFLVWAIISTYFAVDHATR